MGQAQSVAGGLGEQRRLFDRIGTRLEDVGARFPLVNSLLGAIRRKRSKARRRPPSRCNSRGAQCIVCAPTHCYSSSFVASAGKESPRDVGCG